MPTWFTRAPVSATILAAPLALIAFAANSLLCRMALAAGRIDAVSFTAIRLSSGALMLWAVLRAIGPGRAQSSSMGGSWMGAAALFAYAMPFSLAYRRLATGVGALVLFGAVQATMLGLAMWRDRERPRPGEWGGLVVALCGLVWLTAPSFADRSLASASALASASPSAGTTAAALPATGFRESHGIVMMLGAGIAWGLYSLRGRGSAQPLADTTGNFIRSLPLTALTLCLFPRDTLHAVPTGVLLAATSGALASGMGYSLWYVALRELSATRAAILQLTVPVLAASGGIVLLDEPLSWRVVGAGSVILAGVGLATFRGQASRRPSSNTA